MRVLIVNNFVRDGSGIDAAVATEQRLLTGRGHDVLVFERDNHAYEAASLPRRAALLGSSIYSVSVWAGLDRLLAHEVVDVVHVHNLVPFLTGAVYDVCRRHGIPIVQHLHNYRAFCLSSYAYRDGRACDDCFSTAFTACARFRCYRGSYLASAGLVAARWIDWSRGRRYGYGADGYLANSEFTRRRHIEHGMPASAIRTLYLPAEDLAAQLDLSASDGTRQEPQLTFIGSLIAPKGPRVALELAAALPEFQVHLIGAGREERELKQLARSRRSANVVFRGLLTGRRKATAWARSFLTVVPSLWEEPFGLVVPESYSLGVPVLATAAGGLAETVSDGVTGLIMDAGDVDRAAAQVRDLWRDRQRYLRMRDAARAAYEERFTEGLFAQRLEELLSQSAGDPS